MTPEERFLAMVDKEISAPCWLWTGFITPDGYGRFQLGKRSRPAHRVAYELWREPIPGDYEVDHKCLTRRCVNPDHLEAVTPTVNRQRQGAAYTHCSNGHEYTPENTMVVGSKRHCRICHREHNRMSYRRRNR